MPEPWERRADETAKAYEAFEVYRDMGLARSYAKVAQRLGKSKTIIDRWGSRHEWGMRIKAHDEKFETRRLNSAENEREKALKRHVDIARTFMNLGIKRLRDMRPGEIERPETLLKWLKDAIDLERKGLGISESPGMQVSVTQAVDVRQTNIRVAAEILYEAIRAEPKGTRDRIIKRFKAAEARYTGGERE